MSVYQINLSNKYANTEFDVDFPELQNQTHVLLQTDENDTLLMTVSINGEQLGQAYMCFPLQPVIPYDFIINKIGGNFVFTTINDEYPNYQDFGKSCFLKFITKDELDA